MSFQTIEVIDRNDAHRLFISHAQAFNKFVSNDLLNYDYLTFRIKENVENPYIMTFSMMDQDLSESFTINITYAHHDSSNPFSYIPDGEGGFNFIINYTGEVTDITDLFSFDLETGALSYIGQVDFEAYWSGLWTTGINSSHNLYDLVTVTLTDSSGAKDSYSFHLGLSDTPDDGFFDQRYGDGSFFNFNDFISWPNLTGPIDIDTFKYPELMRLVNGDVNGDGIPDMVSLYKNTDYYYPADYGMVQISLGGEFSFPYYSSGIYTWGGTNNWNSVIGNGLGSVIVYLPYSLDLRGQTDYIRGFDVGDFNGDGYADFFLQIGNYIVAGWGDDSFLNSSVQGQNIMDLSSIESDSTNGLYIDLNEYTQNQVQLLAIGDLNRDGKDDLIFSDYQGSVYILDGKINLIDSINFRTLNGNSIQQNINFGDSVVGGDFNGDGRQDLAITADGYDKTIGSDEGAIFIYLILSEV